MTNSYVSGQRKAVIHYVPHASVLERRSVVLVGMMGAGKTTIGRLLSQALNLRFVDLDHELERRCGVSIPVIFDLEGEIGFRRREATLFDSLRQERNQVLATGGGLVTTESTLDGLLDSGVVIYLRATATELFSRTRHDKNRPLLQSPNPQQRIAELLSAREPLYERIASISIETGRWPASQIVLELVPILKKFWRCDLSLPNSVEQSVSAPTGS